MGQCVAPLRNFCATPTEYSWNSSFSNSASVRIATPVLYPFAFVSQPLPTIDQKHNRHSQLKNASEALFELGSRMKQVKSEPND
jgi:hypothetical protein